MKTTCLVLLALGASAAAVAACSAPSKSDFARDVPPTKEERTAKDDSDRAAEEARRAAEERRRAPSSGAEDDDDDEDVTPGEATPPDAGRATTDGGVASSDASTPGDGGRTADASVEGDAAAPARDAAAPEAGGGPATPRVVGLWKPGTPTETSAKWKYLFRADGTMEWTISNDWVGRWELVPNEPGHLREYLTLASTPNATPVRALCSYRVSNSGKSMNIDCDTDAFPPIPGTTYYWSRQP